MQVNLISIHWIQRNEWKSTRRCVYVCVLGGDDVVIICSLKSIENEKSKHSWGANYTWETKWKIWKLNCRCTVQKTKTKKQEQINMFYFTMLRVTPHYIIFSQLLMNFDIYIFIFFNFFLYIFSPSVSLWDCSSHHFDSICVELVSH